MKASKHFLVAYDVVKSRRRRKIAKEVYSYALGGQKSALEVPMDKDAAMQLAENLFVKCDAETDRINLIQVDPDGLLLGRAVQLKYNEGAIII